MSQVISGARAIFSVNGNILAIANNCSYSWNHNVDPLYVIDQVEVAEHSETTVDINFSCDTFRVVDKSAVNLGIMPELKNILKQPELIVEIKDKITSATLIMISGVKLIGRNGNVPSRGTFSETLSFVGRSAQDEGSIPYSW